MPVQNVLALHPRSSCTAAGLQWQASNTWCYLLRRVPRLLLHIQFEKTSDDEETSDLNGIMRLEIVRTLLNFGRLEVKKVGFVLGPPH